MAERMQLEVPPLALHGRNRIPLARGLGSSSAAIVAGVVIASHVLDLGIAGDRADPYSVFALAAELEGHPDNAAPATYGGFTVALPDGFVRRFDPHPGAGRVVAGHCRRPPLGALLHRRLSHGYHHREGVS